MEVRDYIPNLQNPGSTAKLFVPIGMERALLDVLMKLRWKLDVRKRIRARRMGHASVLPALTLQDDPVDVCQHGHILRIKNQNPTTADFSQRVIKVKITRVCVEYLVVSGC